MGGTGALSAAAIAGELVKVGAVEVRTDPRHWFTWKSGRRSPIYCDNRLLMSYPESRARIADALAAAIRDAHPGVEVVAGTATAGIPHAAWVAERLGLPMAYVRGAAKGHGRGRRVEGASLSGRRVVLIEDTISTGGSALEGLEGLRDDGASVVGVQAIFSYAFPQADAAFRDAGVACAVLTTYPELIATLDLDEATARVLDDWRREPA